MAERRVRFRRVGLWLVLIPFLIYVATEVIILVMVTDAFGWWTIALLIANTLLGCWLLQREGRRACTTRIFGQGIPTAGANR